MGVQIIYTILLQVCGKYFQTFIIELKFIIKFDFRIIVVITSWHCGLFKVKEKEKNMSTFWFSIGTKDTKNKQVVHVSLYFSISQLKILIINKQKTKKER